MSRTMKFILALVLGLALATWIAFAAVQRTTRQWFHEDIRLRVRLVGHSVATSLSERIRMSDWPALRSQLMAITRDERIMATAMCSPAGELLAKTEALPPELSCREIIKRARTGGLPRGEVWESDWPLSDGPTRVSVVPIMQPERWMAVLVLVHDLSYIERRDAKAREFLLLSFAILALSASLITVVAARLSWRGFRNELRRLVHGKARGRDFDPVLRDVRHLVDKVASAREQEGLGGLWSPQRLHQTLARHFPGERVIVLANREPYIHNRSSEGEVQVMRPASGLVTAIEPILRACSGVWVAHGSGSADRDVVDRHDRVRVPPSEESYQIHRVWLSSEEEQDYYYGFANEGLWPLCHLAHARPIFRGSDWTTYESVNRKFANAVCREASGEDPLVLVQDYHFALAPRFIREKLPNAVIISFWHIPWPNAESFGLCPWHAEILEGLLGSSIIGFHTQLHCNNFLDSADRFLESRVDREAMAVVQRARSSLIRPYPISIDWPNAWATSVPSAEGCRSKVFKELNLRPDTLLAVGVDRLDYTKGIEERLFAVERMLDRYPEYLGRFVFVQLAAPSRSAIERYQQLDEAVERTMKRINARFAKGDWRPILLQRAHHEPPTVFTYYRAADLCYVSSLHDGMNLVAKEFVAARNDEAGVLVLSRFTGAASELTEALLVNPYDLEEVSAAMVRALTMSPDEKRDRMRAMRAHVAEFNVYRWAGKMLMDAARLRRRATVVGRLDRDISRLASLPR